MNYLDAINQVLKHEGGYVNNPSDKGGATNFGITQKVYEAFKGRSVTLEEMKKMPKSDAVAIYKREYWDRVGGDMIKSYPVAFAIFDQAVNRGVSTAIRQAQSVVGASIDGIMGPSTIAKINSFIEKSFLDSFIDESEKAYRKIASINPSQAVFLNGWLNRVSSLKNYVSSFSTVTVVSSTAAIVGVIFFLIYLSSGKKKSA